MSIKDILINSKFCLAPISKNFVDAIIDFCEETNVNMTFIPSRRQIEWNGGYVNNWTTEKFADYVKKKTNKIAIQRDHGGPGQGKEDDDGFESLKYDSLYFDSIHIDPWKKFYNFEDGLLWTINILKFCYNKNKNLYFEIGTEEAIRKFSIEETEELICKIKENIEPELFERILFCVIQSGTKLENGKNTGNYDCNRFMEMIKIIKKYNKYSKEHNGDFLDNISKKNRFINGLDSINIAPELGYIESEIILNNLIEQNDIQKINLFYNLCLESNLWKKWVNTDFNPDENKEKLIKICGHYIFSLKEFINVKNIRDDLIIDKLKIYLNKMFNFYNNNNLNVLTKDETMEDIFILKKFPVSMSCVDLNFYENDYKYMDMIFQVCKKTGIIQIKEYPSFEDMYIVPHNMSFGKIWDDLFKIMSEKVNNLKISNANILEIGGGSLLLASKILENKDIIRYDVFEKNSSKFYTNDKRINLIKDFFTKDSKIDFLPDIIIHSHVLEHVCYPNEFINYISNILCENKYHCFIVPNLHETFKKKYTNSINFEHNVLIEESYIDVILNNNFFDIIEKEYYLDHSIIYITKKVSPKKLLTFQNFYDKNKTLVFEFKEYYEKIILKLNEQINNFDGEIFLFGGHIFSQYLINFGLDIKKIRYILDNSKEKEDKKLYGTKLVIKNPLFLKNINNVAVIVKVASYQKEIEEQLLHINDKVKIFK